jgi:predicted nucleotidyltransferase
MLSCVAGADREPADNQAFEDILDEAVLALDGSGLRYAVMGGIAATALGGYRHTHDIDVFVKPEDADAALDVLGRSGFSTEKTDPHWLYKAIKREITVDIIFKSAGAVYFDESMIERSAKADFRGRKIRVIAPEDLFVIKALVLNEHNLSLDEHCVRHLNDLLSIVRSCSLDWDYLLRRARLGPRRVLGLLLYAQSLDLLVPDHPIRTLVDMLQLGRRHAEPADQG